MRLTIILSTCVLTLCSITVFAQKDSTAIKAKTEASITSVLVDGEARHWFYSNSHLLIKTKDFEVKKGEEVLLYINDYPLTSTSTRAVSSEAFFFELEPKELHKLFYGNEQDLEISLGKKGGIAIDNGFLARLRFFNQRDRDNAAIITALLAFFTWIILGLITMYNKKSNKLGPLHDPNGNISLSTLILAFWTITIIYSTLYFLLATNQLPPVTETILALLAISGLTTVGSRLVGDAPNANKTFLSATTDQKAQLHRLQTLAFNLIYGGYFIYHVTTSFEQPVFDTNALLLLGISNGVYIGGKPSENTPIPEDK